LIEAPEDEHDFDVMNDETFGDNIDGELMSRYLYLKLLSN